MIERLKLVPTRTRFAAFVSRLAASNTGPSFHFHHLPLPHSPWRFFPSGREYGNAATTDGILDSWNIWANDPWLVQQGFQRHLLQTGFVDTLLGQFLNRLERTGLYDRALIVVAADHGVSFEANGMRRTVSAENIADIARVPLFVKLPGQRDGRIDRRSVQTIDVLPTIADVLDVELPWRTQGRSLLEDRDGSPVVVMSRRDGTRITVPTHVVDADMSRTLHRKARLFGEGRASLFHIGVNTALLGSSVHDHATESAGLADVSFDGEELFEDVRPKERFVPARITGTISGRDIASNRELAVVVNDRVAALTRSWRISGQQRFSALVPETAFREGRNQVGLYLIVSQGSGVRLLRLGETSTGGHVELDLEDRVVRMPGQKSLRIVDDRIAGQASMWKLDAETVRVRGWAADLQHGALVDRVWMFSAGRVVYSATTSEFRWDVPETQGKRGLERVGWVIAVPVSVIASGDVRILAEKDGLASELPLPSDFPWSPNK